MKALLLPASMIGIEDDSGGGDGGGGMTAKISDANFFVHPNGPSSFFKLLPGIWRRHCTATSNFFNAMHCFPAF